MTYETDSKSSAQLEREVEAQRNQVEARIGEIKDRLSPGQLVDEMLSYTKSGGADIAQNLGRQITANPLPAVLLGVSVAWLMSSNQTAPAPAPVATPAPRRREPDLPYARVSGGLKRVEHKADEAGKWWSEFESTTGDRFRAQSNELGERAGHFTDKAGKTFSGFIDDTGNRIRQFQDEAGNTLDDAMGWTSHSWSDMQNAIGTQMNNVAQSARDLRDNVSSGAQDLGHTVQTQTDQFARQIGRLFNDQPLVAGALAFAAGAALGATLPHTAEEDRLVGKSADKLKSQAADAGGRLYEQGKEQVSDVYEDAADKVADLYDGTKERVAGVTSGSTDGGGYDSGVAKH